MHPFPIEACPLHMGILRRKFMRQCPSPPSSAMRRVAQSLFSRKRAAFVHRLSSATRPEDSDDQRLYVCYIRLLVGDAMTEAARLEPDASAIAALNRRVDDLVALQTKRPPWYRDPPVLISASAFLISLVTTGLSLHRTHQQDVNALKVHAARGDPADEQSRHAAHGVLRQIQRQQREVHQPILDHQHAERGASAGGRTPS